MLASVHLRNFTAFESLDLELSPGLNVFIGENGTGKSHLLKVLYVVCDATAQKRALGEKLQATFLPLEGRIGRLAYRVGKSVQVFGEVQRRDGVSPLRFSFSNHTVKASNIKVEGAAAWEAAPLEATYIPPKEILAHAPGFRSMYGSRYIHFSEVYDDLLLRAYRPLLRGRPTGTRGELLRELEEVLDGKVMTRGETFMLKDAQGALEFDLVAEGLRKIALLWLLLQNGTLLGPEDASRARGYVLFWDEPEANLNPRLYQRVVRVLWGLARAGVQVFIATHDYALLKEIDLQQQVEDNRQYYAFFRGDDRRLRVSTAPDMQGLHPNAILETFTDLYDREIHRLFAEV